MVGFIIKSSFALGMLYMAGTTVLMGQEIASKQMQPAATHMTAQLDRYHAEMN